MIKVNDLQIDWLVIDWGTTNFRAFAMNQKGQLQDKVELSLGLLQVEDGQFPIELELVLSDWLSDYKHLPIYMAGMVGSQQGWVNVDYVSTPIDVLSLSQKAHQFNLPWGAPAIIIPGVSHLSDKDLFDVMRGEEIQLFGLAKLLNRNSFSAVLPGTHSKHADYEDNKLVRFTSFMTGELFSVLSKYSILGRGLPEQINSDEVFIRGVKEGKTNFLTHTLFLTRTHRLFKNVAETEVLDYLSGLLIGNELNNLEGKHVYLVGSKSLCDRYSIACDALSIKSVYMNGDDCFLAGMSVLQEVMNNDK